MSGFALPLKYQIRNARVIPFNVTFLDAQGRVFCNHSSLVVQWSSSNHVPAPPSVEPCGGIC